MVCLIVCILISAALIAFCLVLFVVVVDVVAALLVFNGLNFHLVLGLTLAYFRLLVLSLRRGLNKNMHAGQIPVLFLSIRRVHLREGAS